MNITLVYIIVNHSDFLFLIYICFVHSHTKLYSILHPQQDLSCLQTPRRLLSFQPLLHLFSLYILLTGLFHISEDGFLPQDLLQILHFFPMQYMVCNQTFHMVCLLRQEYQRFLFQAVSFYI